MRLSLYLSLHLIKLGVAATLILAAIAEVLDLVDNAGDVLDRGDGMKGLLDYVWMRLPTLVSHALPIGVLAGALVGLALLARNSEIVAMRASGRSVWNLFVLMIPGAFAFTLVHVTLLDVVVPRSESRLAAWWAEGIDRAKPRDNKATWMRVGDAVVSFDSMSDRGRKLAGVRIFERNAEKVVTSRTVAQRATFKSGVWTLSGTTRVSFRREDMDNRMSTVDGVWETALVPADVIAALTPNGQVSASAAQAVLDGQRISNAPRTFYETLIQRVYAAPLGAIVMLLLAMPAAFINWRDPRSGRHAVQGLGAGLMFLLADGLATTLGQGGLVPPMVGAWGAVALFLVLGTLNLLRLDKGVSAGRRRAYDGGLLPEPSRQS